MGGEHIGIVRTAAPDLLPQIVLDTAKIEFGVQYDAQTLALRIIINAG
jgi:hypothetical protein